ncbi:TadE/TadG family type IV pilus assembly protein [Devosia ginsengisoli]|uniref:Pilus assembly protein n=1 Tax=Devosia ginsengisoli TaxID=400770 RepID=A0A5B8LNS3_9HYPH|nr:TadE/TadG family type IV pilus assembly protein [Devosia ginsengisoli]QDZ09335.1 pilus assembly protein [Devosia ginsengisoli]
MYRFLALASRFTRDERGAFAVVFGLMAIVLIALGGAVVDYVALQQAKSRAQIALDAAALALQPQIFNEPINIADISDKAAALLEDRLGNAFGVGVTFSTPVANVAAGSLILEAQVSMPTMFVSLVGVQQLNAGIRSEAQRMMLDLEVAMVLDNSGSMAGSRISNLKTAARCATNILLYDAVNDTTCDPLGGATVKENVKIGLVPFALMVNIGTQFKNESWLDWAGISPSANLNFDDDDNQNTPFNGPVNRAALFTATNSEWKGCVEAREEPYDTTDDVPDTPEKLFLPLFSPDPYGNLTNNYLSDYGGTCQVKTCTQTQVQRNCSTDRWGNVSCSGATTNTYSQRIGSVTTNLGASSCLPASLTQIGNASLSKSGSTYTTTTTYSLLTPRELQERLCKYNGSNISDSRTNFNCPGTAMLPLTNVPNTLTTRINQMVASGNTNIQQGTIWGVHMLTDTEPLTEALPRSDSVAKALIVMTDGENYPAWGNDMNGGAYFSWGYRWNNRLAPPEETDSFDKMSDAMDTKTLAACKTARDLGIRVYVVGLAVASGLKAMLEECASGPEYAFFPNTPSDLVDDFKEIAGRLAPLRLAQ